MTSMQGSALASNLRIVGLLGRAYIPRPGQQLKEGPMTATRAKSVERPADVQLFLRIKHPSLDPAEITRTLDIEPERAIAAGANVSSTGVRRLHSESYWIAKLPTTSMMELAKRAREGLATHETPLGLSRDDLIALMGATVQDVPILFRLRRLEVHQEFFDRINRDGGSVTLIVDRDETVRPIVLKLALKKLAELGIAIEID
jgi:hypothetical protein